ncbi:MAG: ECA polysaccharide chain length modulation protein [Candidatus Erwinia impunctatus]
MSHYDDSDNALDIPALCEALWRGKGWIFGFAGAFAVTALLVSFWMTPRWSSVAVTDKPSLSELGGYYLQQQFLQQLEVVPGDLPAAPLSVSDVAYQEFLKQLASWDTRRAFWQASAYYQQLCSDEKCTDKQLLAKLIGDIQFQPADAAKNSMDTIRLSAQSASQANQLLRDYIVFANQRTVLYLNGEQQAMWQTSKQQLQAQLSRQETTASAQYTQQIKRIRQALLIAPRQQIEQPEVTAPVSGVNDPVLYLSGRPLLQARLESLENSGPDYNSEYYATKALLATLSAAVPPGEHFLTYRYLRTPEMPVNRDSPRRLLWLLMWGATGTFVGAGVALYRRGKRCSAQS